MITSQTSETTRSDVIPVRTPSVRQGQQQDSLFHPPVAVSLAPVYPANMQMLPTIETQHNDPQNSWSAVTTQLTGIDISAEQEAQRLHILTLRQQNRA
ncbi:MAG: hypothetical protein EZS28_037654 [Streblomastix strix]|uniref:Uncharacterized protein n=1 Tax=Streblomastix strix TaxID=222440 RepID=A0A5J4U8T0_9EUKA|nr:MAG: hypothetical protein EZS28_037654 [Streblomastix strix]